VTAAPADRARRPVLASRPDQAPRTILRLVWLHALSRRLPVALALLTACAAGLRGTLYGHWDAYGALQLPLIIEAACAAVIAVTAGSPFGEPERATGRWLPFLRLGAAVALTALAAGLLAAAGTGMPLAGGFPDVLRNVAGLTGIGLLCAVLLGGPLAWIGPLTYSLAGVYALYTDWHPPTLSTPWLWPARPPHDVGGALCAAVVFAAGLAAITLCGARERPGGDGPG
jgi:hypothetical protein